MLPTHSVSAGLDYPAIGPEHACCATWAASQYDDRLGRRGARPPSARCRDEEGIIPALESAHALAFVLREAKRLAGPARPREPLGTRRQGPRPRARARRKGASGEPTEHLRQQPLGAHRRLQPGGARGQPRSRRGHHGHGRRRQGHGQGRRLRPDRADLQEHRPRPGEVRGPRCATWCAPARSSPTSRSGKTWGAPTARSSGRSGRWPPWSRSAVSSIPTCSWRSKWRRCLE